MTIEIFEQSIRESRLPHNMPVYLQALWYDAKGDWNTAHSLIDSLSDKTAAAVHAYLHRKEGDNGNANYWYTRAGRRMPAVSLKEEWRELVNGLIEQG